MLPLSHYTSLPGNDEENVFTRKNTNTNTYTNTNMKTIAQKKKHIRIQYIQIHRESHAAIKPLHQFARE